MNEPEGKITVVMPTGKRMEAIESIADAIAYNAQAAMSLAKVIENLQQPSVKIENVQIHSSDVGISIKSEEYDKETGVYYWDRNDHSEYEKEHVKDYPSELKLESGETPEPYVEEYDEEEIEDMIEQAMYNEEEIPRVRGIYRKRY